MRIISRAEWGARYDNGFGPAPLPAQEVWLHHSVTIAPDLVPPFTDDYAAIRTLEQIGENRFGRGISYTWLITPAGLVFEGHGVDRVGSHTANRNSIARAICLVGNYETSQPTDAQIRAAAELLRYAHAQRWIDAPRLDGGHRDLKQTACPGKYAYAAIPTINQFAASGAAPPPQEGDMTEDESRMLRNQDAVTGALALQRDTVTLEVRGADGKVTKQSFPTSRFRPPPANVAKLEAEQAATREDLAKLAYVVGQLGKDLGALLGAGAVVEAVPGSGVTFRIKPPPADQPI